MYLMYTLYIYIYIYIYMYIHTYLYIYIAIITIKRTTYMQPKTGKIIYGWDPIFLVKQIYKAFLPKQCNLVVGVAGVGGCFFFFFFFFFFWGGGDCTEWLRFKNHEHHMALWAGISFMIIVFSPQWKSIMKIFGFNRASMKKTCKQIT